MRRATAFFALLAGLAAGPAAGDANETVLAGWESEESVERLARSVHKADFFRLSNRFIDAHLRHRGEPRLPAGLRSGTGFRRPAAQGR